MALFGPPGCGKTTALVKLAVKLGVSKRRSVQIVSIDNFRVGAAEQLRAYCTILGVAFQQVDSVPQLATALASCRGKSVVLIDSPGLGPHEQDLIAELGRGLTALPNVERHLVMSAVGKANDLRSTIDRFGACAPQYLLFTHLDETDARGGMVSLSVARNIPVSYLCNGQRIPEDLEPGTAEGLAEAAWEWRDAGPELEIGRQAGSAAAGLG
jgi:flagellar biosynthesis protein FlhF